MYYKHSNNQYVQCKVIEFPYDEVKPYTLQEIESSNILQMEASNILESDPTATITHTPGDTVTNIPWVKHDAKVTIIMEQFPRAKQGF